MPQNNAPPGTVIANAGGVSPGGVQGPAGASSTVTLNSLSPTTAKGDMLADNGGGGGGSSLVRLPVGFDRLVLKGDSTQPAGVKWDYIDLLNDPLHNQLPVAGGGTAATTPTTAFDNLAPGSPATGDLIKYDGTHWVRVPRGTALQQLRTNAGATDIEWGPGTSVILQAVETSSATFVNGAVGTIPYDDTIPQSGEGDALIALAITPNNNTSRVEVTVLVPINASAACNAVLAIFGVGANALAAQVKTITGSTYEEQIELSHVFVPGSTAPLTITVRVGVTGGASYYINGNSGGTRMLGGVSRVTLRLREYA